MTEVQEPRRDGPGAQILVGVSRGPLQTKQNPPLHCSSVIAVSLICPPTSCLWEKKEEKIEQRSTKQSSGSSLATLGLAYTSLRDEEQMKTELPGWEINGEK